MYLPFTASSVSSLTTSTEMQMTVGDNETSEAFF